LRLTGRTWWGAEDYIKEDEMDGLCSMHGRNEKCMQNFSLETSMEEITWVTQK